MGAGHAARGPGSGSGRRVGGTWRRSREPALYALGLLSADAPSPAATPIRLDEDEIGRACTSLGRALGASGCRPGECVAVLAGTRPEMVAARDAALACSLTVVPLAPGLPAPELAYVLAHARPRVLLFGPDLGAQARAAVDLVLPFRRPAILEIQAMRGAPVEDRSVAGTRPAPSARPDVGATLLYTSGTTGRPKGCVRTAEQEAARAAELIETYGLGPDDVHLVACPLAYSAPGILLRAARGVGAATVLLPRFTAEGFLEAAARTRATCFFLVPTQYQRILALPPERRRAFDLSSVRVALVAGAPLLPALRRSIVDWLGEGRLWEFYGSSETGTVTGPAPRRAAHSLRYCRSTGSAGGAAGRRWRDRRTGSDRRPLADRDERLLEPGDRRGRLAGHRRRLPLGRRSRHPRSGRLPAPGRSHARHDHLGRRQRLPR